MAFDNLIIRARSVSKSFGKEVILDDFNLDVWNGSIVGILGASGSGKTTVLRLIAGFDRPDEGIIEMRNEIISSKEIFVTPEDRKVGMVFQDYALFPHLNVFENVAFGLRRLGKNRSEIEQKTNYVLKLVQMDEFSKRRPNQLSGGQQQRVALARALAPEPKVLLLDEPLSALDLKLRQAMRIELKTLQRETGITFVFVTHDQEEALTMSDRIAVISEGEIQQIGEPNSIYENPANQFVANFIGEANLLKGICKKIGKNGLCKLNSGHEISLEIPSLIKVNDPITIFIRPERIKINKQSSSKIKSFISQFTYLGNAAHLEVESNNQKINITLPIDKVKNFKKADEVTLEFPKNHARVINQ